jgi:hypothetical protein
MIVLHASAAAPKVPLQVSGNGTVFHLNSQPFTGFRAIGHAETYRPRPSRAGAVTQSVPVPLRAAPFRTPARHRLPIIPSGVRRPNF